MFVFDCEAGYQPDNGQNDVTAVWKTMILTGASPLTMR